MAIIQKDMQTQSQLHSGSLAQQSVSGGAKGVTFEKYALILTVLACVVCTARSSVGALVVVAAFTLLIVKPEYLLGPILFFTIFDDYMLVMEGASVSRFVTLIFIAGATWLILKRGVIKKESLLFVVLMFLGIILSFFGIEGYTSFPITYILNVLLAMIMINHAIVNKETAAKQFYSIAVLSVIYVYALLAINGFDSFADGMRLSISDEVNSNALAMGLAIVMAVLASNSVIFGKHIVLNILLMIATCVAIFLTGSRSGLIAGVVTTFFVYIAGTKHKGSSKKVILLSVVSVAVLVLVYFYLRKSYPLLMDRFTVDSIEESGGTGRWDVWRTYFKKYFPQYWLVGIGFDSLNMFYAIKTVNGVGHGAHNVIVELLSKTGVIGAVLYGVFFTRYFCLMLKSLRKNPYILFSMAVVLSVLINGIGEDVLTTRFLWFGVGLGYILLNSSTGNVQANRGDKNDY